MHRTAPCRTPLAAALLAAAVAAADGPPVRSMVGWGYQQFDQAQMRGAASVSAGCFATLAIRPDRSVVGWGWYYAFGVEPPDGFPLPAPSALRNARQVVSSLSHALVLHQDGTVSLIGSPMYASERPPADLAGVDSLSLNTYHAIAVLRDGSIRAFGKNDSGESSVPLDLPSVASSDCGNAHSIVLLRDGQVRAWGSNSVGQSSVPADLGSARQVAAGSNVSGALLTDGSIRIWGQNSSGVTTVPAGLDSVTQLSLARGSGGHAMALRSDGTVACWGMNSSGECFVPEGLSNVVQVSAGWSFSAALKADGIVECWGWSANGQCGTGTGREIAQVATSRFNALSLLEDGTVRPWGLGQKSSAQTQQVPRGLNDAAFVAAGPTHSMAGRRDGTLLCWGSNVSGQCNVPSGLNSVVAAAGANDMTVAVRADGSVTGWGTGWQRPPASIPAVRAAACAEYNTTVAISQTGEAIAWGRSAALNAIPAGLGLVSQVAAGSEHAVAIVDNGTVRSWGWNGYGQCNVPPGLLPARQVAAGSYHSLALIADGSVVAWGRNQADVNEATVRGWIRNASRVVGLHDSSVVMSELDDCNGDGVRDAWSIMHGEWDMDRNWVPDACERIPGDLDMSGAVDLGDLALMLMDFGPCAGCPTDLDGSGVVDMGDVSLLLLNFGPAA